MINLYLYILRKCNSPTFFRVGDVVDYPAIKMSGFTIEHAFYHKDIDKTTFVISKVELRKNGKSEIAMSGVEDKNIILHQS